MFNSSKKNNDFVVTTETTSDNITTIIAEDCTINGTIECNAYIKIDGKALAGVKSMSGVILGQKGYIKGDAHAKEVIVYGKIEGNVLADNLVLKSTAVITGNIHIKTLQIETGAMYKGSVNMDTGVNLVDHSETAHQLLPEGDDDSNS